LSLMGAGTLPRPARITTAIGMLSRAPRMRWLFRFGVGVLALLVIATAILLAMGGWTGTGRNAAAVEIAAPATTVWPLLSAPEQWSKWMGNLASADPIPGGAKAGAKTKFTLANDGSPMEIEADISKVETDRQLAMVVKNPLFETDTRYALKERAGRTVVIWEENSRYHSAAHLFAPVVTRVRQQKLEEDLVRLKLAIETASPAAVAAAVAASTAPAPPTPEVDRSVTPSDAPASAPAPGPSAPVAAPAISPAPQTPPPAPQAAPEEAAPATGGETTAPAPHVEAAPATETAAEPPPPHEDEKPPSPPAGIDSPADAGP
jgi:hypothetical protein